jgi:hypothetical protein
MINALARRLHLGRRTQRDRDGGEPPRRRGLDRAAQDRRWEELREAVSRAGRA